MFFSVIVPTHHRESLKSLITSLERQTYDNKDFEVLVVPSPQDQNLPWLEEYRNKNQLKLTIIDPSNDIYSGKSASFKRNSGAKAAQGDWLAFIDDDCVADNLWLLNARKTIEESACKALEGYTHIPLPSQTTLTFKGLQRLSESGGYQTCNMFYLKSLFLQSGGFDLNFPFYLEDTDLAWTFLDHDWKIAYSKDVIVSHPVPPHNTKRLLENAWRAEKIPYLYKKHQHLFLKNKIRALHRIHIIYLIFYFCAILYLLQNWSLFNALVVVSLFLLMTLTYTIKQLSGCIYSWSEFSQLLLYYPITPILTLFQLWRGNLKQRTLLWR